MNDHSRNKKIEIQNAICDEDLKKQLDLGGIAQWSAFMLLDPHALRSFPGISKTIKGKFSVAVTQHLTMLV